MGKTRVRAKGAKGKRWRKGQSSSSNPRESFHRQAARGKFSDHLSRGRLPPSSALPLTAAALASLHDNQGEEDAIERDDGRSSHSRAPTSVASSSALTLIETAHPVFGAVRKLWNSPTESHRVICAVLAAVSEVVKSHEGKDTETEYFGALVSVLESSADEESVAATSYLLCLLLPSVPREVLQLKYGVTCKILTDQLARHETSSSTALLKSLVQALTLLLEAQPLTMWRDSHTQKVFQTILNFTVHPKPKLRKTAQASVVALLREGTASGDPHPAASPTASHCRYIITQGGVETASLHVLGMLRECMANLSTQQVKALSEIVLQTMTLGSTLVRTTCLHTLHGALSSLAGPQGLTASLTARLIAALYDHQPGLTDWQLLQAWLTVMLAAHTRLASLSQQLCVGHLVRLFSTAISCLLSHKSEVTNTSVSAMQTLLTEVIGPYVASMDFTDCKSQLHSIQKIYLAVVKGLDYQYQQSWKCVLKTLTVFHRVAGERCHTVMAQVLPTLCSLHSLSDFKLTAELEEAVGVAIATMGPQVVLNHVPLELDSDADPPSFHRSWLLPVLRDHVSHTHLSYFMDTLLPLAGRMRARAEGYSKAGRELRAKAYTILYHQVWSLLPGFCREPRDVPVSFPGLARILGTALTNNPELRVSIATSLKQLIESSREKDEGRAVLGRFSKNYLPILFNLYTGSGEEEVEGERLAVLHCVQAYISVTNPALVATLAGTALQKISQQDLPKEKRHRLLDLVAVMVDYLPPTFLLELLDTISPLLDSVDSTLQKKSYKVLQQLLSSENHAHKAFVQEHLPTLTSTLTDSLSTSSPASKKPRLRCLLCLVDHIGENTADFIATITPEVILCTKETNEKSRGMAYQLLVRMGYAAQHCYGLSAEEAVTRYMNMVLAGLAGSAHMVSASVISLSRLLYEFHDVVGCSLVTRLMATMCKLLSSHIREVVKAAFGFIKITVRVLPPSELSPHLEDLIGGIMRWSANPKSHFRLKARFILEKLIRKFGFELVCGLVHPKHQKLMAHIRKVTEREKKKRGAAVVARGGADSEPHARESRKLSKMSYEHLLQDIEGGDEEEGDGGGRRRKITRKEIRRAGSWIKESSNDDPVNLLDSSLAHKISSTSPNGSKPAIMQPFPTSAEGKLVISEDTPAVDQDGSTIADVDTDSTKNEKFKRKRKYEDILERPALSEGRGGGRGIHRKNTGKQEFDYGSEYRAKRARGDVKVKGQPDPYAYVPLLGKKLNRRKKAKLAGQFDGVVRKARSVAASTRQRDKR